jgi:predicted ATPase/class 3 adenylate cyclase
LDPPRGTVTLLFTDVEGSTRLLHELGEQYVGALADHRDLLRAEAAARGGYEVDTQGDAFFFAFARATDAVAAAASAQRALAGHTWPDGRELRVRMGIHTGEPSVTREGYVGVDVHRAARICAAAHGGQVVLSQTTRDLLDEQALDGIGVRDLGDHRLKDLSERQRLFQLVLPGLPADFPALKTLESRPTNLPTQPTPLIGRDRELAELRALLARADVRLITLTGPAGTGKTRLALHAAAEVVEEYAGGAFLVTLAAVADPALVVPAIAKTLGVREAGGEPLERTLREHFEKRDVLLVLDNFEQVVAAAPELSRLLASRAKALVTSRAPLRLSAEHVYSVPPLPLPRVEVRLEPESVSRYDAVRLFVERASAARSDFRVTADNAPAIAEICARLDGLPLAIELAAARSRLLTPEALLARLDQRLRVLTGGARDLPERQQTLRAAIDWSHGLLTEPEQALFARLSVFRGGRTLEAIEAICDPDDEFGIDVLDAVESLVDKSLLRQEEAPGREPRFVMLETIHEYAGERLDARGERETVARRHAEWFLELAREAWEYERGEGVESLDRLDRERTNLQAALEFWRAADAEAFLELAGRLWRVWIYRGGLREGRAWLDEALALASSAPTPERVRALAGAFNLSRELGDLERARELGRERLAVARALGVTSGVAAALGMLGTLATQSGEFREAIALQQEALAVARSDEEAAPGVPAVLHNLGFAYERAGDSGRAREAYEEALALRTEGSIGHAITLTGIGGLLLYDGRPEEARPVVTQAIRASADAGVTPVVLEGVLLSAAADAASGSAERAARLLGWVDGDFEESGRRRGRRHVEFRDRADTALRERLGEEELERLMQEGRRLTAEEAVALALGDSDLS